MATITTLSKPLALPDVLHVPNVSQNLISVSQLCKVNDVSIKYFPWHLEIKDLKTGRILLQENNEGNLYTLPFNHNSTQLHHATKPPFNELWHNPLGH
jgi:hypothetical protein